MIRPRHAGALVVALLTLAATAPTAAAEPVEVIDEGTATHCTTETCVVHATTPENLRLVYDVFGFFFVELRCGAEITLELDGDGGGQITDVEFLDVTGSDPGCGSSAVVAPCALPWEITQDLEETGAENTSELEVDVCFDTTEGDCLGPVRFSLVETTAEGYAITTDPTDQMGSSICYLDAFWDVEELSGIHVDHAPDPPAEAATNPGEAANEFTGIGCTTTACSVHVASVGNVELHRDVFGVTSVEKVCNAEFTLKLNHDGSGQVTAMDFFAGSGSDPDCDTLTSCDSVWEFTHELDETDTHLVDFKVGACIETPETGACTGQVLMRLQEVAEQQYELTTPFGQIGTSTCYLDGSWQLETPHNVHINHLHE